MSSSDHSSLPQIDLPESAWTVVEYMFKKRIPLECHKITELWQADWESCPLCGGELEYYEGGEFCLHNMKQ